MLVPYQIPRQGQVQVITRYRLIFKMWLRLTVVVTATDHIKTFIHVLPLAIGKSCRLKLNKKIIIIIIYQWAKRKDISSRLTAHNWEIYCRAQNNFKQPTSQ